MHTCITPVKLPMFNNNIPDTCIKCNEERGTLYLCILECAKVKCFCQDIISMIDKTLIKKLPLDSMILLLGIYPTILYLQSIVSRLTDMCITS